jgi:peptide/nickel transport system substrate-binding protein
VTVAVQAPFTSLNPATVAGAASATNAEIARLTGTGFGYRDDAGVLVRDPSFGHAELVEGDRLTARYTIADDVRWSDDTPIDAADLLLSWAAGSGALEAGFDAVPDAALAAATQLPQLTANRRTIFLHFDSFTPDWESALSPTLPAHIVASRAFGLPTESESQRIAAKQALVDAIVDADPRALDAIARVWNESFTLSTTPADHGLLVAAGPYRVDELSADRVVLTANPSYRGDRTPRVETIEVRAIEGPASFLQFVAAGGVDIAVASATPDLVAALQGAPGLAVTVTPGGELEQLQLMLSDSRDGAFDDPRIREAFLHTVPRAELAESAGAALLDSFLVAPSAAEGSAGGSADGYAQADPAASAALLAEAGSPGAEVCVLYDPADPVRAREFELIRDSAAPAGFLVTDCSTADWMRVLGRGGAYDAALLSFDFTSVGSAAGAGEVLRSDSTTLNLNRFADPEADALIDQLTDTDDPALQQELVGRLDQKMWVSAAGVPLFARPIVTAVGPAVTGVTHSAFGGSVLWNAWTWQPTPHTPR